MSDLLTKSKEAALLWKMAKIKFVLFSVVTIGVAWQSSTSNLVVSSLKPWELFNVAIGMIILWGNTIIAYLDKTASTINSGKLPIGEDVPIGETTIITKSETEVKETQQKEIT